jgi:L-alanine-DL-glutamate epimerase-like enolase superfamily enzyme
MKITNVTVFPLVSQRPRLRVGEPIHPSWWGYDQTLIRIDTEGGISGWGCTGVRWEMAEGVMKVLWPHLVGEDALQPEVVTERLHQWTFWYGRGGGVTSYIGAVNHALWDILGKHTGLSISRLFGGRYVEKVKPYASMLFSWPVDEMVANLESGMERNFRAFKMGWGTFGRVDAARDEELVRVARKTVGDDCEVMIDAGGSDVYWHGDLKWAMETARMLRDYGVRWFEEPLRADDIEGYRTLRDASPVHIATGEVIRGRLNFEPFIRNRACDILQPDQTICGGLSESRRIWQSAYDANIQVVMHGWNTAVGAAADLQLTASMPNGRYLEYWHPAPYVSGILAKPLLLDEEGMLPIPDGPGLGIEIDEDALRAHARGSEDYGQ